MHLANDLTAETFAQALRSLRRFDGNREDASVAGWLYGIAGNVLRHYQRRERVQTSARRKLRMQRREYVDEPAAIDERLTAAAGPPDVELTLDGLPEPLRQAVRLRVIDELPYAECAQRLGCSEQSVRHRVSRGLARMRNHYQGASA